MTRSLLFVLLVACGGSIDVPAPNDAAASTDASSEDAPVDVAPDLHDACGLVPHCVAGGGYLDECGVYFGCNEKWAPVCACGNGCATCDDGG